MAQREALCVTIRSEFGRGVPDAIDGEACHKDTVVEW